MRRLTILCAALVAMAAGAAGAVQDTCTFTGTVTWSATGTTSGGSVNCTGGDSTLGGDDVIVIASGTTTISAGAAITGTSAANAGITVSSGATLAILDGATIALGPAGLTGAIGSTVTMKGKVRSYGAATSTLLDEPETTPGRYFVAGDMLPCYTAGAIDCATNPSIMGFAYATARWNASSGTAYDRFVDNSLSGVATTDWICFWDPDPNDKSVGADVNNCYPVTSVSTQHLAFNVRQGSVAQSGYPLARRDIKTWTTPNAETRGARTFTGVAGTLTRTTELRGRWLRFRPSANTYADSRAYKISNTTDGGAGADTFKLGDSRGVLRNIASGESAYVDYGWEVGDPYIVIRPVTITSATTGSGDGDSVVSLLGTASIAYAVFRDTTHLNVGYVYSATAPMLSRFEWVIAVDQRINTAASWAIGLYRLAAGTPTIKHVSIAGGSESATYDKAYGMMVDGDSITVEDVSVRHTSDDMVVADQTGTGRIGLTNSTFRRIHAAYKGDNSDSGNGIDTSCVVGPITYEDVVCDDCTTTDNAPAFGMGDDTVSCPSGTSHGGTERRVMVWGNTCGVGHPTATTYPLTFQDLTVIGGEQDPGGTGTACSQKVIPRDVDGFVVRDCSYETASNGNAELFKETATSIKNGFFLNISHLNANNSMSAYVPNNGTIENVAFVNLQRPNTPGVTAINLYQNGTYSGGTQLMKNVLFMQTPEFASVAAKVKSFYREETTISPTLTMDGVAFVGLRSVGALRAFEAPRSDTTLANGLCFWNNALNHNGTLPTPTGTASIQMDQPIGMVDEQAYRLSDAAGGLGKSAICGVLSGASSPGVRRSSWGHWISKIDAETLDQALGGGAASTFGPRAY